MRIGIFVVMAGRNAGGPETYEHQLIASLAKLDQQNEYDIFCLSRRAKQSFQLSQSNIRYSVLWPNIRWISIPLCLPFAQLMRRIDFCHATFVPPPISPHRFVFTAHDLFMFTHPEYYPSAVCWRLQKLMRRGLKSAQLILCNSQHTKDSIVDMFGISSDRLAVTYLGIRKGFRPHPEDAARQILKQKYGIEQPYLLFVGQMVPRKNIVRVLEAFHQVRCNTDSDLKLAVVGNRAWGSDEVDATIEKRGLKEHICELGYVPDEDLPIIYSGAQLLAFPSLDEGFGFPVLEAMACGTPVLTSNSSALREVAGDAAVLVDPSNVDDIAANLQKLLSDSSLRASLREKGLVRSEAFTWDRTARQTLEAYERLNGA